MKQNEQVAQPQRSLSRKATCEFLAISISTLERLEKSKDLIPARIGRHVTYDLADVVAFRNSRKAARYAGVEEKAQDREGA